jgi:PKD repeat protein
MKKVVFFLIVPLFINAQTIPKKIRVLFIGNSYTYVNNLPLLVANIAHAKGDSLFYDTYCPGGYTFNNHFYDANTTAKIALGNWDYVVLQAQSQEPSFSPAQVNSQTLPFAIKLDSIVKHYNPCANTVFYETWGRKFGDASNCAAYPPVCTYTGMQNRLRASYKLFADTVHECMAPVGEAFRQVISTNSVINLYQADQSHPSIEGSYLAAAVFYESLYRRSVISNTYNPGVSVTNFTLMNQVAHTIVTDSISTWNIDKHIPKASFTYTAQSSSSFQFQTSASVFSTQWYFGDGASSSLQNPLHTYLNSGTYTVSLVAYDIMLCKKDSVTATVSASVITTGLSEKKAGKSVSVYPNPCREKINLSTDFHFDPASARIQITNTLGQLVYEGSYSNDLSVSQLQNGIYYIKLSDNLSQVNSCFIKNE